MRILLAQNSAYYPAHGGGDKSNRLLLEALAGRGHECRVVARAGGALDREQHESYLRELAARGIEPASTDGGIVGFRWHGVEVRTVTSHTHLRRYFTKQAAEFRPEVILASTDDPAQLFLEAALEAREARVVYLTRTTLALPFGPEGALPSVEKTERLRRADAVVGVSQYVADYVRNWSGIPARALPISLLGEGPWPRLGWWENEFVTMVNPCAVKGIAIFAELARRMPGVQFAAVPMWGTTREDLETLRRQSNVRLLQAADDIGDILRRTRALVAPSLWAEARSRIVVEAMLAGVPVLASRVGGLPEAMLGVDYLLPVRPIERYRPRVDEQMVPVAEVPEQDVTPWEEALRELLSSRERWEALSRQARAAALGYAESLSIEPFEALLEEVVRSERPGPRAGLERKASPAERLSPEKRALLAMRLKKRPAVAPASGNPWFPGIERTGGARLRLFAFPYAGGGAAAFHGWEASMPDGVAVCPARLPGRESRTAEAPIDRIEAMVEAVAAAIEPHLDRPFALFGHSMGAVIGFELARWLRRGGLRPPVGLLVASARGPQLRRGHEPAPAPSDDEFLEELRRLEGVPREVLENPDLLRYLLPALRADSELGRVCAYRDEPPLAIPIRAYHGTDDPRLPREVIEAWGEQTTAGFRARGFPGGHFFIHTAREEFLRVLGEDVAELAEGV